MPCYVIFNLHFEYTKRQFSLETDRDSNPQSQQSERSQTEALDRPATGIGFAIHTEQNN